MTENNKNGFGNGLTYLLIGGGIGATLALLFAPKSGSELRGKIADITQKGYEATLEKASSLREQSADVIGSVKEKASAVYDFAAAKVTTGSEAAANAVSTGSESIAEGIENVGKEVTDATKQAGPTRKSASIF